MARYRHSALRKRCQSRQAPAVVEHNTYRLCDLSPVPGALCNRIPMVKRQRTSVPGGGTNEGADGLLIASAVVGLCACMSSSRVVPPNDTGERPPPETGSRKLRDWSNCQDGPATAAQGGGSAPSECSTIACESLNQRTAIQSPGCRATSCERLARTQNPRCWASQWRMATAPMGVRPPASWIRLPDVMPG